MIPSFDYRRRYNHQMKSAPLKSIDSILGQKVNRLLVSPTESYFEIDQTLLFAQIEDGSIIDFRNGGIPNDGFVFLFEFGAEGCTFEIENFANDQCDCIVGQTISEIYTRDIWLGFFLRMSNGAVIGFEQLSPNAVGPSIVLDEVEGHFLDGI